MDRRAFLAGVLTALVSSMVASGQPRADVPRVGVLLFRPMTTPVKDGFLRAFREYGYVDGQNIVIEWRSAEGKTDRAAALAGDLVRLKPAVIVAEYTPAIQAAKNATQTISIVMAPAGDPVASGFVESLARPGGNITGVTDVASELSGKRLELLREVIPGLTRVGLLINGADPLDKAFVDETKTAASRSGIQVDVAGVPRAEALDAVLSRMTTDRVGAVIVQGNVPVPVQQTAESTLRHRLPSISLLNQFVVAGGLMSYGASVADIQRRAASYVDRILKGARAGDLPVERPTKYELVINLKTAKALGLTMPQSLLLRADQVID